MASFVDMKRRWTLSDLLPGGVFGAAGVCDVLAGRRLLGGRGAGHGRWCCRPVVLPPSQVFGVYPEELWESLQDVRPRTGVMRFAFSKTTPGQSGR